MPSLYTPYPTAAKGAMVPTTVATVAIAAAPVTATVPPPSAVAAPANIVVPAEAKAPPVAVAPTALSALPAAMPTDPIDRCSQKLRAL